MPVAGRNDTGTRRTGHLMRVFYELCLRAAAAGAGCSRPYDPHLDPAERRAEDRST
jgi:hypothetical protein